MMADACNLMAVSPVGVMSFINKNLVLTQWPELEHFDR